MKMDSNNSWKPNLFVPGFAKCGTTAVCDYLAQHPSIYVIEHKEPGTLAIGETVRAWPLWYGKIDRKIADEPLWSYEKYKRFFHEHKDKKFRVDGTPLYSLIENFAEKLENFSSDTKVILILREQMSRICSLYLFTYARHKEDNFLDWIEKYLAAHKSSFFYYDTTLEFYRVFKNNLLVIENEQLRHQPQQVMDDVFKFLNLRNIGLKPLNSNVSIINPRDSKIYRKLVENSLKPASKISNIGIWFLKGFGLTEKDDLYYKFARAAPDRLMLRLFSHMAQQRKERGNQYEILGSQMPDCIAKLLREDYEKTIRFCKERGLLTSHS